MTKFQTARMYNRKVLYSKEDRDNELHLSDVLTEGVPVYLVVQAYAGNEDEALWCFTWDAGLKGEGRRILKVTLKAGCEVKKIALVTATTCDKKDLFQAEDNEEGICVFEYHLGDLELCWRGQLEILGTQLAQWGIQGSVLSPKDWALAVLQHLTGSRTMRHIDEQVQRCIASARMQHIDCEYWIIHRKYGVAKLNVQYLQ